MGGAVGVTLPRYVQLLMLRFKLWGEPGRQPRRLRLGLTRAKLVPLRNGARG